MLDFPSEAWTTAYKDAINQNEAYRASGKDWTHGVVAMVVDADAGLGIPEDLAMWLDVHQGQCRGCKLLAAKDADAADFIIKAPYATWRTVIEGKLDPTMAMMQNKLKLVKGHMPTMVRFVTASKDLVKSSEKVPTKFRA